MEKKPKFVPTVLLAPDKGFPSRKLMGRPLPGGEPLPDGWIGEPLPEGWTGEPLPDGWVGLPLPDEKDKVGLGLRIPVHTVQIAEVPELTGTLNEVDTLCRELDEIIASTQTLSMTHESKIASAQLAAISGRVQRLRVTVEKVQPADDDKALYMVGPPLPGGDDDDPESGDDSDSATGIETKTCETCGQPVDN